MSPGNGGPRFALAHLDTVRKPLGQPPDGLGGGRQTATVDVDCGDGAIASVIVPFSGTGGRLAAHFRPHVGKRIRGPSARHPPGLVDLAEEPGGLPLALERAVTLSDSPVRAVSNRVSR